MWGLGCGRRRVAGRCTALPPRVGIWMNKVFWCGVLATTLLACEAPAPEDATGAAEAAPTEAPLPLAETVVLNTTPFRDVISLNGETVPVRQAMVSSEMSGRVSRFLLEEGQRVEEGALVMRVSTTMLAPQREQLETTLAQLAIDIARQEQLIERGLGTTSDLQRLQTEAQLTRQQIGQIDTQVGTARTTAPIDGVVVQTMVEEGEFVGPGTPVARIIDIDTLHVMVGLPEHEIRYVREGMEIDIHISALDIDVRGTLTEIGLEADRASRAFPLEITIDNSDGALRAGMRATALIPRADHEQALLIPRDAIMQGIDGQEAFVFEDGKAMLRTLETGAGRGGYLMVTSGLAAGERLIVRGQQLLVTGEPIEGIDQGACCAEQYQRYLDGTPAP